MRSKEPLLPTLQEIVRQDPRYRVEGYLFLLSALHFTQSGLSETRHVSSAELLEGIRSYSLDQFGPLARTVLAHWGVAETIDFGRMVFNLVDKGILHRTEQDALEDFHNVYGFKEAFDRGWKENLKANPKPLSKK